MRGDRLARQWRILQMLLTRRQGMTAADLSGDLGQGVRSIYRDLDALQKAGFPLYTERDGRNSRWTVVEGFRHSTSIPFTPGELMALAMAQELMRPLEGTVFEHSLKDALRKVRAILPDPVLAYLDEAESTFTAAGAPSHDYAGVSAVVRLLKEAIESRNTVEFTYRSFSSNQTLRRQADPYGLLLHEATLYLVARCHLHADVRNFAIDRISLPAQTKETFTRPKGFSTKKHMQESFGAFRGPPEEVDLYFDPKAARYIKECTWHPTQKLEDAPRGACRLKLKVPLSEEITRFILSWTPHCEVLAPASLREKVEQAHHLAWASYQARRLKKTGPKQSGPTAAKSAGPERKASKIKKHRKPSRSDPDGHKEDPC